MEILKMVYIIIAVCAITYAFLSEHENVGILLLALAMRSLLKMFLNK